MDFTPVPRKNKNQILSKDLIIKNDNIIQKIKKKVDFHIGESVNLRDLMKSQSTGRRKVNLNE